MSNIPMLERFAAQSLVEHDGELIFSKERFAKLIVQECAREVEGLEIVVEDGHEQWNRAVAHAGLHIREYFRIKK